MGAAGSTAVKRKAKRLVQEQVDRYVPANIAQAVTAKARDLRWDVQDAVHEGREAMRLKEAQLQRDLGIAKPTTRSRR
jgi:hypothetical protein